MRYRSLLACSVLGLSLLAATPAVNTYAQTAAPAAQAQASMPVYYRVVMDAAMVYPDNLKERREMVMDFERVGDNWGAIYFFSRNYNMGTHKGAVKEAKLSGDTITLKIGTDVTPDKWIPGGQGSYTLTLKKTGEGTYEGTYTGNFRGVDLKGTATATTYTPQRDTAWRPLAPQEHPRLLFRESDLPDLRKKAQTPFGKAAVEKIQAQGTPMAMGFMYQLTGDKQWAKRAEADAELYLNGTKPGGDPFVPKKPLWAQLEQLAMVYDLCYDALSDDYKARYRAWAADMAFQIFFAPEALGTTNWHVVSNHVANVYSGITLNSLVLFDEPSPPPAEPTPPYLEDTLAPAPADYKPGEGVPVVTFVPGKSPTEWIHTNALRKATPDDPREQFYGLEKATPAIGSKVKVGDFELTFEKMTDDKKSEVPHGGMKVYHLIEAAATSKAKEPFTMVLHTVLDVKEPGTFVVSNPVSRANLAQLSLNGKLLASGQVIKLEKGLYPLTQMVQWRMRWGEIAPLLSVATDKDIEAWAKQKEQLQTGYQTKLANFAAVKENWKRTAGGDPAFTRMYRLARFTSHLHCDHAVGKGGFQGEVGGYSVDASSGHAKLWPIFKRVMGYDLTPNNEYPDYIPRKIIGGPQDINGTSHIGGDYFASLLPTIRAEWQPEILQAWHDDMKVTGPDNITNVLNDDPVRSFVTYPLEMKPAPIGTKLPKVWQAPGLGYYALRSGWDKDAFIVQAFAKAQIINGWNGENAGTYRLRGLGINWAGGPTDRVRQRQQENVVWMPEADISEGSRGKVTFVGAEDATLNLTMNLDEVYERKGRYWHTKYGNLRYPNQPSEKNPEIPAASGITGKRAMAFDMSGLGGVPMLYAIVDRIDGGNDIERKWLIQPPVSTVGNKSNLSQVVKATDNGFVIQPPGATSSLRGMFAYPAKVEVSTEPMQYKVIKAWGKGQGQELTIPVNAAMVKGKDHFFFVATVSPDGKHPDVQTSGSGLDATVTIGKRTIKFDGEKIVLGQK